MESSLHPRCVIASGKNRFDYARPENRPLFGALFRFALLSARRGCWRTALEQAKLLLSLDPESQGSTKIIGKNSKVPGFGHRDPEKIPSQNHWLYPPHVRFFRIGLDNWFRTLRIATPLPPCSCCRFSRCGREDSRNFYRWNKNLVIGRVFSSMITLI